MIQSLPPSFPLPEPPRDRIGSLEPPIPDAWQVLLTGQIHFQVRLYRLDECAVPHPVAMFLVPFVHPPR